jgi:hypothetical protein
MKKLQLMRKAPRLHATWVATGDARRPLACIWVIFEEKGPNSGASSEQDAGKVA